MNKVKVFILVTVKQVFPEGLQRSISLPLRKSVMIVHDIVAFFRFKLRIKTSNHDLQGVIEGDGEAEEEAVVPADEQQMNEIVNDEAPSMYKVGVPSDGRLK